MRAFQIACLNWNTRAGWLYHPIELWVLVGACLGSAAPWKSSEFDKKPGACGACAVLMSGCWFPRGQGKGQGSCDRQAEPVSIAFALGLCWGLKLALFWCRAAWIGLVFLSMALRLSRWAAVLARELPRQRRETRNSSQVRDVPAWQWVMGLI